jgi:hypothetical protein
LTREHFITARLDAFYRNDLQLPVSILTRDEWQSLPLAPAFRFGWLPPVSLDDDENVVALLAPSIIDEVTADLDDVDLDAYLLVIEATAAFHLQRRGEPPSSIERALDLHLLDVAPQALVLRCEIEMTALDRGIIPTPAT